MEDHYRAQHVIHHQAIHHRYHIHVHMEAHYQVQHVLRHHHIPHQKQQHIVIVNGIEMGDTLVQQEIIIQTQYGKEMFHVLQVMLVKREKC